MRLFWPALILAPALWSQSVSLYKNPADRARTKASMELTLRWAERSKKYFGEHKHEVSWGQVSSSRLPVSGAANTGNWKPETGNSDSTQSLFGIIQGGMDLELRKESAERTVEIGFL